MAFKHNKKRNTGFLFEVLLREEAEKISENKNKEAKQVRSLIEKYFKGTELTKELDLYTTLLETRNVEEDKASKIINEVKSQQEKIDEKKVFNLQTKLINEINNNLSESVFSNFIKNYRSLASVYQFLNRDDLRTQERVNIQEDISQSLQSEKKNVIKENLDPIDEITYRTYVKKFNEHYSESLISEQKKLMGQYIMHGVDSPEMKIYLNEEIGRLKVKLKEAQNAEEIQEDEEMQEKLNQIMEIVDKLQEGKATKDQIVTVMETQDLVHEIFSEEEEKENDAN